MTEKRALVAAATTPDSMSPRRGPLVTTSENTLDIRPRIASGVTVWLMIWRQTALTLSAAPASARHAAASQIDGVSAGERDRAAPDRHRADHDRARAGRRGPASR